MRYTIIIALILLLVACQTNQTQIPTSTSATHQPTSLEPGTYNEHAIDISGDVASQSFASAKEFKDFLQEYSGGGGVVARGVPMLETNVLKTVATSDSAAAVPQAAGAAESTTAYSGTNNQVASVDEGDILKTDGEYIYTITGNTLYIVKAYPAEDAQVIKKMDFNESTPTGIFVDGNHMAVFGNFRDDGWLKKFDFVPRKGMTFFNIYDISDKNNPKLIHDYKFEGNYFDSRMHDGYIYFVVRENPEIRPNPMPLYFDGDVKISMPIGSIRYFNIPYKSPELVTVHSIKLDYKLVDSKSLVVEGGQNLYMSENNIYITYTEYVNEWDLRRGIMEDLLDKYLSDSDRKLIEKIKETDNEVLSQSEKESKIFSIYLSYESYIGQDERDKIQDKTEEMLKEKLDKIKHFEYTVINKMSIDNGKIDVKANGKVPGHIINQFSMDEYDSVFRIATTISQRWSTVDRDVTRSTNNIYTLDTNLKVLGKLEGISEGESIYSTRFIGDRLYLVTYKQVDPFFVIDMSDPKNIIELGKLKIPGFSRYLHPYDIDTIIGIGQETTSTGRTSGLKISLFDVSDIENPKEIAKFVTDERYAQSTALYEHKAFLFDKSKNLLVIPAYNYNYRSYEGSGSDEGYNGAFVFWIDKDEIRLRGLIDHSQGSTRYYSALVERSLYIGNDLYTKSPNLLRINDLSDLHSVKNITLSKSTGNYKVY